MPNAPTTSVSLLRAVSNGAESARWSEFWRRYEQMMRGYLRARYPSVDEDDVLQETMLALVRALPEYQYTPDERGHFRNYLTGILRNKAVDAVRRDLAQKRLKDTLTDEAAHAPAPLPPEEDGKTAWQAAAAEAAIEQLMANPKISPTNREVFRHVALMHEDAASVAERYSLSRGNVDQIKHRMIARLTRLISAMTAR